MNLRTKCMFLLAAIVFAPTTTAIAQVGGEIPVGKLGFSLGTYLTIEGIRPDNQMKSGNMIVDTVNGKKLDAPILIQVENVSSLPEGKRCVMRGYESGKMIGVPDEAVIQERLPLTQAKWQFFRFFIATAVLEPKGLEIMK